jgi:eukaryotic-like serine/threonine-protein kinase
MICPDDNELVAYAEGRIGLRRRADLELHLDACPACAAAVAEAARVHASERPVTRVVAGSFEHAAEEPVLPGIGDRVGRYRVVGVLGRGGMGTVLQAHDPELDRDVALKLLRRSAAELPDGTARLVREARSMAQLAHPNVVSVFEVGVADGRVYVAMELVEGEDLRSWLIPKRSWREIVDAFVQAGRGLQAAHEAGVLHRDFKPDNVLLSEDRSELRVRVADFGLAQSLGTAPSVPGASSSGDSDDHSSARLTRAGTVLGTPAYMAPEQHTDDPIDPRTDQYAFCAALYEALWRTLPFRGRNSDELAAKKLRGAPKPPREPQVPGAIRRAVLRGLASDPSARHPDMASLLDALVRGARPRVRLALVAGGCAALVLATLGAAHADPRCADADARMAELWSPSVRAAIEQAFVDPARPYTAETATRVLEGLDANAASWSEVHARACTSARDGDPIAIAALDDRMRCLEAARTDFAALVDLFAQADDVVVLRSIRAVAQLPAASACLTAPGTAEPTLPAAAQQRFAKVNALANAGRWADAWVEAERLPDDPAIASDPHARVRALLLLGRMRQRTSAFEPAEAVLTEAYYAAQELGDARLLADAAISVLAVVCKAHVDPSDADPWARHAAAAIAAAGDDARDRATLHRALGTIALRSGDYATARRETEQGRDLLIAALGEDHIEVADFANNLANVAFFDGRYEDAIELNLRALEIRRDQLGAHHPAVADSYNNLGAANFDLGRYEESARDHEQSLAIAQAAFGRMSADVAASHNNLGGVYHALGDHERAIAHFREALEIWAAVLDPDHPDVAYAHNNLGNVLHAIGRDDEAARSYERALAIRELALGADHPDVAITLTNLAVVDDSAGRLDRARSEFERAIVSLERALGPQHPDVATIRDNLGLVLRKQGELDASIAMHRSALAIHLATLGREHPQTATTEYGLGRALRANHDPEAIEHLRFAIDGTPPNDPKLLDERRTALAGATAELR